MAAHLRQTFSIKAAKNEPVFVTFLTAGFPTIADTIPLLLSLEQGGADVIELGVPFSDPQADGPAIQHSDEVAIANGVTLPMCLDLVKQARSAGLTVPVLLMGYYNPILAYGEKKLVEDARIAGASGFIIVDLPPEDAYDFRGACTSEGLSFIPLVAPGTTDKRVKTLLQLADSFIYVVSKNGTTGATANVSSNLESLVARIRNVQTTEDVHVPLAVGFGVSTHDHFTEVGSVSDGVVIGSQLIKVIGSAPADQRATAAQKFCEEITNKPNGFWQRPKPLPHVPASAPNRTAGKSEEQKQSERAGWFGGFGGQYVPEALYEAHSELEKAYIEAVNDPTFWQEFESYYAYMGRPSDLYLADRLTAAAGGARIWLKREDLNHTGSHKINNVVGQMLLAKRLGKTRIIAETGAGQHGVATATVAAKFGLKCVVYMGAEDVRRQQLNAYRMKMLGAEVVPVESGSKTLKDAINEANRDWVTNIDTTHYVVGSAIGPHPFPSMVRDFQSIIGKEVRKQLQAKRGKLPDVVVACVGGGSNAIGIFHTFIPDKSVRLIGVEAGGDGVDTERHSATLSKGKPGVLHGVRTYLLQNKDGQITETHSISAGLDYSGIGPEHAWLKDSGRADYRVATDVQALEGFRLLTQLEGIIPALESSHAIYGAFEEARKLPKDQDVVVSLSGNGAKDVPEVISLLTERGWDKKCNWYLDEK